MSLVRTLLISSVATVKKKNLLSELGFVRVTWDLRESLRESYFLPPNSSANRR